MGSAQTSETNEIEYLKTHYYNNSYEEIRNVIFNYFKNRRAVIVDINDEYMEFLIKDNVEFNIKVCQINDKVCSLDVKTMGLFIISGKKSIKEFYAYTDSNLSLNSVGLVGDIK